MICVFICIVETFLYLYVCMKPIQGMYTQIGTFFTLQNADMSYLTYESAGTGGLGRQDSGKGGRGCG